MRALKQLFLLAGLCLCIVAVPPLLLLNAGGEARQAMAGANGKRMITVYFADSGKTRRVSLEEYLVGVLCAEMPAVYEKEALMAQAVAARSYCLYRSLYLEAGHEGGAAVCTDPSHCKAYIDPAEAEKAWGEKGSEYLTKMTEAVKKTAGEVLTYDGLIINAVFHAASSGRTEYASDVWPGSVAAYLVSVESAGDLNSEKYSTTESVTAADFKAAVEGHTGKTLSGSPEQWIGRTLMTPGGSVKSVEIGGTPIAGTEIRALFSLASAAFDIDYKNESFVFSVRGYGHGVGMSQNGANALALEGKSYKEILAHYYVGAQLEIIYQE